MCFVSFIFIFILLLLLLFSVLVLKHILFQLVAKAAFKNFEGVYIFILFNKNDF